MKHRTIRPLPFPRADTQRGVSLIETLIAAAIILAVAVGVAPLILRARSDNMRGNETTLAANFAKSHLDDLIQKPFFSSDLVLVGTATEKTLNASWTQGDVHSLVDLKEGWFPDIPDNVPADRGRILWRRDTRIRQFSITDLTTPLDGDTSPISVHIKEIEVDVETVRQANPLGAPVRFKVRYFKVF